MDLFEHYYTKYRAERGEFDEYIADAQRTVDVGDIENPAIPGKSCLRTIC